MSFLKNATSVKLLNAERSIAFFKRNEFSFLKDQLNIPKKTSSAYNLYYVDTYDQKYRSAVQNKTMLVKDVCKAISASWNNAPESVKSKYQETFKALSKKNAEQTARTLNNFTVRQMALINLLRKVPKITQLNKLNEEEKQFLSALPRPPPSFGRGLFVKDFFEKAKASNSIPNGPSSNKKMGEIFRGVQNEWTALPSPQKDAYNKRAEQGWNQYKAKVTSFLNVNAPAK